MLRHFLWEQAHANGCLPSLLLFTGETTEHFPLSLCPKHAKCHKRLPSFLQLRKKIIPFLYRLLYHAHLWPWQAWSFLSLYTSATTWPVQGCWLRSIPLFWGSMLPSPLWPCIGGRWGTRFLYGVTTSTSTPIRSISGSLWEVLLSCLVLEITDQFCKLRKHQKQSGGKKQIIHHLLKIRIRHAFSPRGKIAS